ncbi:hypothetical protein DFS33DRAFT_1313751 [Desarmillaria ectypa]|nr:hypothetical protein DFS33DRAFT_1313751 [Desarmillaria ectypa]
MKASLCSVFLALGLQDYSGSYLDCPTQIFDTTPLLNITVPMVSTQEQIRSAIDAFESTAQGTKPADLFDMQSWMMGGAHVSLGYGLLSLYEQAENIQPQDVQDFVGYSLQWVAAMEEHHDHEDRFYLPMFPSKFASTAGTAIHDEHKSFAANLQSMHDYLVSCLPSGATYGYGTVAGEHEQQTFDGKKLKEIVDGMIENWCKHMTNELTYLSPSNLRESGLTEDELKKIGAETATHMKSQPKTTFGVYVVIHTPSSLSFPPMPGFVKNYIIPYLLYLPYRRLWRFAPKL